MGYIGKVPADVLIDPMVDSAAITDATIVTADIADDAITSAKLAANSVDSSELIDGSVDNSHLAGSIAVNKTLLAGGTGLTLSTNTLNVDAAQTQITSVGTLTSLNTSGNIGLGVTPDTWHSSYDVLQGANFSLSTDATAGASKAVTLAYNQYIDSGNAWTYINADEASYYQQYNGAHYFATAGAGSADGDVTNSTKLTIANDGSVGIGTASPAYRFDVVHDSHNGTIAQFGGDSGDGNSTDIRIRNTHQASSSTNETTRLIFELGSTNAGIIEGFKEADGTSAGNRTGGLAFYTSNANSVTEKMRIDSAGKIGINTTTMDAFLNINSGDNNSGLHVESTDGGANLSLADNSGSIVLQGLGGALVVEVGGSAGTAGGGASEKFRIDSSGRVGIGAAPDSATKLLVDHDQNAYTRILVKNTDTGSAAQSVTHYETDAGSFTCGAVSDAHSLDGAALLWHVPNKSMVFATNNTLAFTIDNSQEGIFSGALHVGSNQSNKEMFTVKGYNNRVMRLKTLSSDRQWQWGLNTGSPMYYSVKNYSSSGSTYFGVGVCPAQYHLDVAGNIGYTGSITDYSLRELKKDIVEIDGTGMIDKLKKLPLYKYNMKTSSMQLTSDDPVYAKNKGRYGLIADDEVNRIEFPELINWSKREDEAEPKVTGVDTTSYIGILHGAIKELISKVEALENA